MTDDLAAEVRTACWAKLRRIYGPGPWEAQIERLRSFMGEPDEREQKARDTFASLRSAALDVLALAAADRAELRRLAGEGGSYERAGGAVTHLLAGEVCRGLVPLLPALRIGHATRDALATAPDYAAIERLIHQEKKRVPRWKTSPRVRLAELLATRALVNLPHRRMPLSERQHALISLIVLGVEPSDARGDVATVITLETQRYRIVLRRRAGA